MENFGAVGKKGTAAHVTGKFWSRRKKRNCNTRDWKILVPLEKKELQHT